MQEVSEFRILFIFQIRVCLNPNGWKSTLAVDTAPWLFQTSSKTMKACTNFAWSLKAAPQSTALLFLSQVRWSESNQESHWIISCLLQPHTEAMNTLLPVQMALPQYPTLQALLWTLRSTMPIETMSLCHGSPQIPPQRDQSWDTLWTSRSHWH